MQHDIKALRAHADAVQAKREALCQDIDSKIKALREELHSKLRAFNAAHPAFSDGLVYSARARCRCGRGLCYKEHDGADAWECEAVVVDGANPHEHEAFPFAFYDIKSETQPSAMGETTRSKPVNFGPA